MDENSAYENGRISSWYSFTARRFNSLLGFFNDPAIPDDFIDMKIKYLREGSRRTETLENYADFDVIIEKMTDKMIYYRRRLQGKQAQKILILLLLTVALPKLATAQPLLGGTFNTDILASLQKLRGFGT